MFGKVSFQVDGHYYYLNISYGSLSLQQHEKPFIRKILQGADDNTLRNKLLQLEDTLREVVRHQFSEE